MKSKNIRKKKILKLEVNQNLNFGLIGISSHENDYRLVWAINNTLNLNFKRAGNLCLLNHKTGINMEFSKFIHSDEERFLKFILMSNRCPEGYLFPDIRTLDYLVQLRGEPFVVPTEELAKSLRRVSVISAAFIMDPRSLKGIENIMPE